VNTTFFFSDGHGGDGIDDFFGTSPAALMLEAEPAATPEQVNTALETTALDMGAAGFDFDSGHGLIQANQALAALTQDADGDGVGDTVDNCTRVANGPDDGITAGSPQNDTDGDGYGNICDGDLNQDDYVNVVDLGLFKQRFFTADPDADLNGDGIVNVLDLGLFKAMFFKVPGPSGMAP
jgi:hypothetical protein